MPSCAFLNALSFVMTLVLPSSSMMTSILLRSPSPFPSPALTPLPALQSDLSSSSSSSASGSCLDLHQSSSATSTRRIRFAPLPEPRRDLLFEPNEPSSDDPQLVTKSPQTLPAPNDLPDGFVVLSPSVSPVSSLSSARSTPTIRISPDSAQKSSSKLFRPFAFLRRSRSSSPSPLSQSPSLPGRNISSSTSLPNSPSLRSVGLSRFSTEDILSSTKSLFRPRSGSTASSRPPRASSPPPKSLHRSASTGSGQGMNLGKGKRSLGVGFGHLQDTAAIGGSGTKKRRASSSALTPGAGGGRHACSVKVSPNSSPVHPSIVPSSPIRAPKKHVKMLNGRVYGAKRYAAQTLANPFANVRDEPEFVEWGYGGMGSVHASAGIGNDMWKGLQRSERGGALLAGSSFGPSPESTQSATAGASARSGRGSGARATSPIARRRMSDQVPECGMGNVGDEDDGSGMGWVKRRRAEREAKVRLEQEAKDRSPEGRRSGDSMDASVYASTASTTTSLTACTSVASTVATTPASSPLASRSPSLTDLNLTSSPLEPHDPSVVAGEPPQKFEPSIPLAPTSKEDHKHHILTAVRLSPSISALPHKRSASHGRATSLSSTLSHINKDGGNLERTVPLSPVDTEMTTNTNAFGNDDEELNRDWDEEADDNDEEEEEEEEVQDIRRKTALGAGVEKISRHKDVEVR